MFHRPIINSLVKPRRVVAFPDGRHSTICMRHDISILYCSVDQTAHSYPTATAISSMPQPKGHHLSYDPPATNRAACSKYYRIYRAYYPFPDTTTIPMPKIQPQIGDSFETSICLWNSNAVRLIDFKSIFCRSNHFIYLHSEKKWSESSAYLSLLKEQD